MLTKIFCFSSTFFCFLDSHIFVVLNILFTTPVCPLRLRLLASNVVWTNLPLLVVNEQQIPQRVTAANLKAYKRRVLQPPRTKKTIKKTSSGSGVPAFPLLHPTCFIHGCVTVHCRRRVSWSTLYAQASLTVDSFVYLPDFNVTFLALLCSPSLPLSSLSYTEWLHVHQQDGLGQRHEVLGMVAQAPHRGTCLVVATSFFFFLSLSLDFKIDLKKAISITLPTLAPADTHSFGHVQGAHWNRPDWNGTGWDGQDAHGCSAGYARRWGVGVSQHCRPADDEARAWPDGNGSRQE